MIIPLTNNQPFHEDAKCNLTDALLAVHATALAAKKARLAAEAAVSDASIPTASFPPVSATALVPKRDLSPTVHLQRLKAYRVHDLPDRTVYEFWKIGGAAKSMYDLRDRTNPRQCATITRYRNDTFILAFYPDDGNNQVTKQLPLSQLGVAVDDLKAAGF
jgi:hypothetical protein